MSLLSLMGTTKCLMLMRALILTSLAIIISTNVVLIVALVIGDSWLAKIMGPPNTVLEWFELIVFDVIIYFAIKLLWLQRGTVDEEICSQVQLETSHDCGVSDQKDQIIEATYTNHVLNELEDNIKSLGTSLDQVLGFECETNLQEKVVLVNKDILDIGEKHVSKVFQDHLGQTVDEETSVSEALHVEHTESIACHDSSLLSEHGAHVRNLTLPYGQTPTSKFPSTKNMVDMINHHAVEGFGNGELVRPDVFAELSQQAAKCASTRCNEIIDTGSKMQFGQDREHFSAHFQFANILDEFWGNLFELHGKLTEKGKIIRLDLLIGLDVQDSIQSYPCCFDRTPVGPCDPLKKVNFIINNGNCILSDVVGLRRSIMDSFLKENPSLLNDKKVSYFVIGNDQVQDELLIHENFYGATQLFDMACIQNISYLDKADWLIQHRGGYNERLFNVASEMEIFGDISRYAKGVLSPYTIIDSNGRMLNICTLVMGCGEACIWQPSLIISFGVWCIS
ncbi:hypothetical protein ACP4OV_006223 [Aristida adscensionis]